MVHPPNPSLLWNVVQKDVRRLQPETICKDGKKKKNLTKCTEGLGISEETYISSCGYVPAALFSVLLLDKRPLSAQFSPILLK